MATGKSMILHPFSDLSKTRPLFFVCNVKQYLKYGEGRDFKSVLNLIRDALPTVSLPGPLTYVMHCFDALYCLDDVRDCGVSWHILGAVLSNLDGVKCRTVVDDSNAKRLAVQLVRAILLRSGNINTCILFKICKAFRIGMDELVDGMRLNPELNAKIIKYKEITSRMQEGYHIGRKDKRLTLKKFVEKGWWRAAENSSTRDETPELVDFLVNLTLEMGHADRAAGICRHSCEILVNFWAYRWQKEAQFEELLEFPDNPMGAANIRDFISAENVIWVDTKDGLADAAKHFAEVDVVGIDSEWIERGPRDYTVSILQIATVKKVFIFDLIKLSSPTKRHELDRCLKPVFCSDRILKLGYSLKNDVEQLFKSYGTLDCFKSWKGALDFQEVYDYRGLTGLTSGLLDMPLDKTNQVSNWGKRPLSQSQMEYAALDAFILIPIFIITNYYTLSRWESKICNWRPSLGSLGYEKLPATGTWRDKHRRKKQRTSAYWSI